MLRLMLLGMVCFLAACDDPAGPGTDPGPTPQSQPVNVVIASATETGFFAQRRVTLTLENTGGVGFFRVSFWSLRNTLSGPHRFWGSTDPVEVNVGYRETVEYTVNSNTSRVDWVIVEVRDPNSAVFRQSACYRFLASSGPCPP